MKPEKPNHQRLILSLLLALLSATAILPARAVSTTFTYQGRIIDNGTPFSGAGVFKFALVTTTNIASPATATANLTGAFVTSCTVVLPGSGYTTPPAVTFVGGGGSNAAATAMISGGMVTNITINNTGSGYSSPPNVLIAPPPSDLTFVSYWSNDGTSANGSEPTSGVDVGVTNGLFTVVLGDVTVMNPIDSSLFAGQQDLQLRIWFNDGINGSAALSPVQNLTPAPYAIEALNLSGGLQAGQLTSLGNANGGGANFFVGPSGNATTTGSYNTANGNDALLFNINGTGNTGNGADALFFNTNGNYNTANGFQALYLNTSGAANTADGAFALYNNKSGANNTAEGESALSNVTTGSGNIALGQGAGTSIVTGNNNIDIGNPGFGDETGVIRIGTTQTKAVFNGIYGTTIASSAGVVCVNPSGLLGTGSASVATLGCDLQLIGGANYHNISLIGGNSSGYLYGSFPALGDGIHLGYNYYYDAGGTGHVGNSGGGTSRISASYGEITMLVGGVNTAPTTLRLDATTSGVTVYGTFNNSSDRNAKQDFAPVNPSQILDKVLQLPLSEWSYKTDAATRHIGPMGQDFYSTFNIGTDEKHIAPIDEGGVALAAIQGLNQKLNEKDAEIQNLEKKLDELQALVKQLAAQK